MIPTYARHWFFTKEGSWGQKKPSAQGTGSNLSGAKRQFTDLSASTLDRQYHQFQFLELQHHIVDF